MSCRRCPVLLNRLLAVDLDLQSAMLEELFGFIEARVEAARQAGTLDAGVETIRAESLTCLGRDVLTTCPKSGAETILTAIERRQRIKRYSRCRASRHPPRQPADAPRQNGQGCARGAGPVALDRRGRSRKAAAA